MAEEHGPTQHHQPEKAGNPKAGGLLSGNKKWYLVGGLALVGVLVFMFVKKSNANSSTTTGTTGTAATTGSLDPATEAQLQSALNAINGGTYGTGTGGGGTTNNYYSNGSTDTSSGTGTGASSSSTGTTGNGIMPMDNPPSGDVWVIGVPNGTGGWMNAVFPTGQSVSNFYQDIGYNNGYPGGLNYNDVTGALSKAGATVQSNLANTKMAMTKAGSSTVPHTSK